MADSNLNEIIETSLQKIKELANNETVIGDPITVPGGVTIIPVSKIAIGFASGGLDFPAKKESSAPTATKFGGGGGTGITVTPIAFLTVSASGVAELLPINTPGEADSLDKITALIEKTPDILEKIKKVFAGKKKEKVEEEPKSE
jgi:sporulation protein YtfJ